MQYILIEREKVKDKAYHETMPDGRVILPFSAVKMGGVMEGVTIVPSGTVLKAMILEQKAAGVKPPQEDLPEDGGEIVSGGGETNEDGGDGEYVDFEPAGDGNTENADGTEEAGEEPTEGEEVQGEEAENGSGDGSGDGGKVSEGEETNSDEESLTEKDNLMEDIDL